MSSTQQFSDDPMAARIAAKVASIKAQYGGREILTESEVLSLTGYSRMTAWKLAKLGAFIPRASIRLRCARFTVDAVAHYLVDLCPPQSAPSKQASPQDAPKKRGRPCKTRNAA